MMHKSHAQFPQSDAAYLTLTLTPTPIPVPPPQVRSEVHDAAAVAVLSRPRALNALTTGMVESLLDLYQRWEADPGVACILLKASLAAGLPWVLAAAGGRGFSLSQPPLPLFAMNNSAAFGCDKLC